MPERQHFNRALQELNQEIAKMGTLVEESLYKAIQAFEQKDVETAEQIIKDDVKINNCQQEIEDRCTVLIATEQPVAKDLRRILTTLKIVSNLERIGDHAVHLARATKRLFKEKYLEAIINMIPPMAEIGLGMVREVITAFISNDSEKAIAIAKKDDELDKAHKKVFASLIKQMQSNPENVLQGADLLLVIRFMERLGDHVTNICEWIVFCDTGKHVELNR
ncbi:MAG: phosphate signaling complex protein PhoU [Spirochaetota bacterium]